MNKRLIGVCAVAATIACALILTGLHSLGGSTPEPTSIEVIEKIATLGVPLDGGISYFAPAIPTDPPTYQECQRRKSAKGVRDNPDVPIKPGQWIVQLCITRSGEVPTPQIPGLVG